MRKSKVFFILLFLVHYGFSKNSKLQVQNNLNVYILFMEDFQTNAFDAKEDLFGNKYLYFNHSSILGFTNDTLNLSPGNTLLKMSPAGELLWYSRAEKGFPSIDFFDQGSEGITIIGSFLDTLRWDSLELISNGQGSQGFIAKFSNYGEIKSIEKIDVSGFRFQNIIKVNNGFILTSRFDSIFSYGNNSLLENPASLSNQLGDIALIKISNSGLPIWAINLGGASAETIVDLDLDPLNEEILVAGFWLEAPSLDPAWPPQSSLFLKFDSTGNLINSRSFNTNINNKIAFEYSQNGDLYSREYNDSSEGIFPANIIYPGQEHLSYFYYDNGIFSPPVFGISVGAPRFVPTPNSGSATLRISNNLIIDHLHHPQGMSIDSTSMISSNYSFTCFDLDSFRFNYSIPANREFDFHSGNFGSHFYSKEMEFFLDTVISIDTFSFNDIPGKFERIFVNFVLCEYFKNRLSIVRAVDSLQVKANGASIQWYKDGQLIIGENNEKLRLQGSGIYYAEISNYYGCIDYSDTISIVSGIDEKAYNSLKIYPNPARSQINFEFAERIDGVLQVYDIRGVLIESYEVNSKSETLDVSSWNEGVYIYRIETEKGVLNGKLLIR